MLDPPGGSKRASSQMRSESGQVWGVGGQRPEEACPAEVPQDAPPTSNSYLLTTCPASFPEERGAFGISEYHGAGDRSESIRKTRICRAVPQRFKPARLVEKKNSIVGKRCLF
jgi:hypothetical protein